MRKTSVIFATVILMITGGSGCVSSSSGPVSSSSRSVASSNMGYTITHTEMSQDERPDSALRIYKFRDELVSRGFSIVSTASSDTKEQTELKGKYGNLGDIEVTLLIDNQIDMKRRVLQGRVHAFTTDANAKQEFDTFTAQLQEVISGFPLSN